MINLLPPEAKENILYARRNSRLLKWSLAILVSIVGVIVVVGFGQLYLSQSVKSYTSQLEDTKKQLELQKLEETQKKVTDISSSIKLVVQVLSKQVVFSKLLRQIGAAIPPGAVLRDLSITQVQGGIDLTFNATDYQTGTQILVNLQDENNKIFEQADIESINCQGGDTDSEYPCQVSIRALFGDNSPYLFINSERKP